MAKMSDYEARLAGLLEKQEQLQATFEMQKAALLSSRIADDSKKTLLARGQWQFDQSMAALDVELQSLRGSPVSPPIDFSSPSAGANRHDYPTPKQPEPFSYAGGRMHFQIHTAIRNKLKQHGITANEILQTEQRVKSLLEQQAGHRAVRTSEANMQVMTHSVDVSSLPKLSQRSTVHEAAQNILGSLAGKGGAKEYDEFGELIESTADEEEIKRIIESAYSLSFSDTMPQAKRIELDLDIDPESKTFKELSKSKSALRSAMGTAGEIRFREGTGSPYVSLVASATSMTPTDGVYRPLQEDVVDLVVAAQLQAEEEGLQKDLAFAERKAEESFKRAREDSKAQTELDIIMWEEQDKAALKKQAREREDQFIRDALGSDLVKDPTMMEERDRRNALLQARTADRYRFISEEPGIAFAMAGKRWKENVARQEANWAALVSSARDAGFVSADADADAITKGTVEYATRNKLVSGWSGGLPPDKVHAIRRRKTVVQAEEESTDPEYLDALHDINYRRRTSKRAWEERVLGNEANMGAEAVAWRKQRKHKKESEEMRDSGRVGRVMRRMGFSTRTAGKAGRLFGAVSGWAMVVASIVALGKLLVSTMNKIADKITAQGHDAFARTMASTATGMSLAQVAQFENFARATERTGKGKVDLNETAQRLAGRLGSFPFEESGFTQIVTEMAQLGASNPQIALSKIISAATGADGETNYGELASYLMGQAVYGAIHGKGIFGDVRNARVRQQVAGHMERMVPGMGGQFQTLLGYIEDPGTGERARGLLASPSAQRELSENPFEFMRKLQTSLFVAADIGQAFIDPGLDAGVKALTRQIETVRSGFNGLMEYMHNQARVALGDTFVGMFDKLNGAIIDLTAWIYRHLLKVDSSPVYAMAAERRKTTVESGLLAQTQVAAQFGAISKQGFLSLYESVPEYLRGSVFGLTHGGKPLSAEEAYEFEYGHYNVHGNFSDTLMSFFSATRSKEGLENWIASKGKAERPSYVWDEEWDKYQQQLGSFNEDEFFNAFMHIPLLLTARDKTLSNIADIEKGLDKYARTQKYEDLPTHLAEKDASSIWAETIRDLRAKQTNIVQGGEGGFWGKLGWGTLATLLSLAAGAAFLIPFDGPLGEIALGTSAVTAWGKAAAAATTATKAGVVMYSGLKAARHSTEVAELVSDKLDYEKAIRDPTDYSKIIFEYNTEGLATLNEQLAATQEMYYNLVGGEFQQKVIDKIVVSLPQLDLNFKASGRLDDANLFIKIENESDKKVTAADAIMIGGAFGYENVPAGGQ